MTLVTLAKAIEKKTNVWELFAECARVPRGMNPLVLKRDLCGTSQCPLQILFISVSMRIDKYCSNTGVWYACYIAFYQ